MSIRSDKEAIVAELTQKLAAVKGAVLTDYRGLTVAQDTKLRRKLRDAGVEYRVVKNTMTRIAAHGLGLEALDPYLEGPTAIAMSFTDPVAPAKIISQFSKENKILDIKVGVVEGKVIDVEGVKALASLPSREVLLAMLANGMQAPIVGIVNVLQGNIRKLAYALDAVREAKESA
jgi:large subunit ribosomal protein L10